MRDRAFERFFVFISGLRAGIAMVNRPLLYEELARKLARAISTGRYPVGSYLPKKSTSSRNRPFSAHHSRRARKARARRPHSAHAARRHPRHRQPTALERERTDSSLSDLDRLASKNPRKLLSAGEVVVSKALAEKIRVPPGETMLRFSMVRLGERRMIRRSPGPPNTSVRSGAACCARPRKPGRTHDRIDLLALSGALHRSPPDD